MTAAPTPHDIKTFSLDTVTTILADENLDYRTEEHAGTDVVRTGFINAAISFVEIDGGLTMEAMWRGAPATEQASLILAAINEWNLTQFTPTLRFFEVQENTLAINALRQIPTSAGLSHNQVGAFIMTSLETATAAFEWLEQQFPDLVTWKDDHDEH